MSLGSGPVSQAEIDLWCSSGLLALTGPEGGPPVAPPRGLVAGLDGITQRIEAAAAALGAGMPCEWPVLVTGRAALLGLSRQGRLSANSSCRLLETSEGWMALNLPRDDDVVMLDAFLEQPVDTDHWAAVAVVAAERSAAELVARARLLGLAASALVPPLSSGVRAAPVASVAAPRGAEGARVVDLSSMWAGPLCASLLGRAGMDVLKVESTTRPDGARLEPTFYSWLHAPEQRSVTLDFSDLADRALLRRLLESADVVIESSRPRALRQLGLDPENLVLREGAVWVSITGYGRDEEAAVAFGDDAAVAGGLVGFERDGRPVFCGDAIADPLTGLVAAAHALEAFAGGGGVLLDVAMASAVASLLDAPSWGLPAGLEVHAVGRAWFVEHEGISTEVLNPILPAAVGA